MWSACGAISKCRQTSDILVCQARRVWPLKNHNFWNCLTFLNKHLIFVGSLKEPLSVDNRAILKYAQTWIICPLKSQIDILNRLAFLNQHLIFLGSLKEPIGGNSVKISNGRAFSLFETVLGCQAFSHIVLKNSYCLCWYHKMWNATDRLW